MNIFKIRRLIALLYVASALSGCTFVPFTSDYEALPVLPGAENMPREERIFLYQSRIANDIFDRYPSIDSLESADPALLQAEAQMMESCSALTQAVLAHNSGSKPSLSLRWRVMRSIDDCETAARETDSLLNDGMIADAL